MSNLKPGEYETATGKRAWWKRDDLDGEDRYTHVNEDHASQAYIRKADLRAAAQALIALADELETEYVMWLVDDESVRIVLRNGEPVDAQVMMPDGQWVRHTCQGDMEAAFKAGQERGL